MLTISGNKTSSSSSTGTKAYKFDVNPDHTHFIIYDDESKKPMSMDASLSNLNHDEHMLSRDEFRSKLEYLFTRSLSYYKRQLTKGLNCEDEEEEDDLMRPNIENRQVPMVCLMIRGDLNSLSEIEYKIRKEIPVIVFKGSGGVADIISFAFEEMAEK